MSFQWNWYVSTSSCARLFQSSAGCVLATLSGWVIKDAFAPFPSGNFCTAILTEARKKCVRAIKKDILYFAYPVHKWIHFKWTERRQQKYKVYTKSALTFVWKNANKRAATAQRRISDCQRTSNKENVKNDDGALQRLHHFLLSHAHISSVKC